MVSSTGEGIWLTHTTPWSMVEREVETGKVQRPPSLATVELLGCAEILQVLVVRPDFDGLACPLQVMPPLLEGTNDGKHLGVVNLVVPLDLVETLGLEGNGMPFPVVAG